MSTVVALHLCVLLLPLHMHLHFQHADVFRKASAALADLTWSQPLCNTVLHFAPNSSVNGQLVSQLVNQAIHELGLLQNSFTIIPGPLDRQRTGL